MVRLLCLNFANECSKTSCVFSWKGTELDCPTSPVPGCEKVDFITCLSGLAKYCPDSTVTAASSELLI